MTSSEESLLTENLSSADTATNISNAAITCDEIIPTTAEGPAPDSSPLTNTHDEKVAATTSESIEEEVKKSTADFSSENLYHINHKEMNLNDSFRGFPHRSRKEPSTLHGYDDDDDTLQLARLLRRDLPFSQSRNRVLVYHNHPYKIFKLLKYDLFHVVLRYPIGLSLLCLLSIWTIVIMFFAFLYVEIDSRQPNVDCGLGTVGSPIHWGQAFAFSLETTTTGTFLLLVLE
jgi:hypothetical protein